MTDHANRYRTDECDWCGQEMYYVDADDVAAGSPDSEGWHVVFGDDGSCPSPESQDGGHLADRTRG